MSYIAMLLFLMDYVDTSNIARNDRWFAHLHIQNGGSKRIWILTYSEFESRSWRGVLATDRWFSPGTPVTSTNKTDHHDMTEILLKVVLNTITLKHWFTDFAFI
jgi:hypothetical protein